MNMQAEHFVAAAEHSPKTTRGQRKGIFEGVYIPTHSERKEKENQVPAPLQTPILPPKFKEAPRRSPITDQAPS